MEAIDLTQRPGSWAQYVGQDQHVRMLRLAVESAKARKVALDHILLTADPGVGKTTLAILLAQEMTKGRPNTWRVVQPPITWIDWMTICDQASDGDVVIMDEAHRMVEGGKSKAEWLLAVLEDNVIQSALGPVRLPAITIIAATTDPDKIPPAIVSRFPIQVQLSPYDEEESGRIAQVHAKPMFTELGLPVPTAANCRALAGAAGSNPRAIRRLLALLRDLAITGAVEHGRGGYDIPAALRFADLTEDGLDRSARRYLQLLKDEFGGKAGAKAISSRMGTATDDVERLLLDRGYIARTSTGRQITPAGVTRALRLEEAAA